MSDRFALPLATMEGVCPTQVLAQGREPLFQLSLVGGIAKQQMHSQISFA